MNNYKLIKNIEWKEVEINGEDKEIPKDWEVGKLINLGDLFAGKRKKYEPTQEELINNDIYFSVGGEHIGEREFDLKNKIFVSKDFFNKSTKGQVVKNDILIIKDGATTGKNMFVRNKPLKNMLLNEHVYRFVAKNINPFYLYLLFNSKDVQNILAEKINGIIPSLNQENFAQIETSFIQNIQTQSSIASILSHQESIIQDIESLISKYESRFQYLSDELLSGRLRVKEVNEQTILYKNPEDNWKEVEINGEMKEIPKDWEVEKLINLGNLFTGKRKKYEPTQEELMNNDIYFSLGGEHIGEREFDLKNKIFVSKDFFNKSIKGQVVENDILIIKDGATTGKNMFVKNKPIKNMLLNEHVYRFVAKNINSFYLYLLFNGKDVQNILEEKINGIIPSLNQENFSQIETSFTKDINEQNLIVHIMITQENLINQQKELLAKEKQKFDWLLDNLLSGKYLIKD